MPEQTRSGGRSLSTHSTARLTQSVGVPATEYQFSRTVCMRSGRLRVRACPEALCSRSGATTKTSASCERAATRVLMPSEKMPSSLVTRIRVIAPLDDPPDIPADQRRQGVQGRLRDPRVLGDQGVAQRVRAGAALPLLGKARHHVAHPLLPHDDVLADALHHPLPAHRLLPLAPAIV